MPIEETPVSFDCDTWWVSTSSETEVELSIEVVRFLMLGVRDGRVTREAACRLVEPWVSGAGVSEPGAEFGAQDIHGFDMVTTDGRIYNHLSHGAPGLLLFSDQEVRRRINAWLERHPPTQRET